jgi:hypothetical protein
MAMRGLTRDEIADVLVTIRPQSEVERELKRRAEQYVNARDSARREDAALAPQVARTKDTYETAMTFAELCREALASALAALNDQPELVQEIEQLSGEWQDVSRPVSATNAADQIEQLKEARQRALTYAFRCNAVGDDVVAALGERHSSSSEVLAAQELLRV